MLLGKTHGKLPTLGGWHRLSSLQGCFTGCEQIAPQLLKLPLKGPLTEEIGRGLRCHHWHGWLGNPQTKWLGLSGKMIYESMIIISISLSIWFIIYWYMNIIYLWIYESIDFSLLSCRMLNQEKCDCALLNKCVWTSQFLWYSLNCDATIQNWCDQNWFKNGSGTKPTQ
jgi:hypothetical protein